MDDDAKRDGDADDQGQAAPPLSPDSSALYRSLAEVLPNIVWTASFDGQFDFFNRRWYRTTGLSEAASLRHGWLSAVHPHDLPGLVASWKGAVESRAELEAECRLRTVKGTFRWHLCRALPERALPGDAVRWSGTFTDIDEQKRAHEIVRAAVQMRDDFLSVASHELRTPLTTLRLQLGRLGRLPEDGSADGLRIYVVRRVEVASRQVARLCELVDSLLDGSRMAAGQLALNREVFNLVDLARDVGERFRDEADAVGCELRLPEPARIEGSWDRLRLDQVITNLLANAIKYGPGKPISLAIRSVGTDVRVSVSDQGIGIAPMDQHRVFDRFERAVSGRQYGGLGLGLYIVREIVGAHGGEVELASQLGSGSTFTAVLPKLGSAVGSAAVGVEGLGAEGLGTEGLGTEGLSTEGLGTEGLGTEGLSTEGLAAGGLAAGGLADQEGMPPVAVTCEAPQRVRS